MKNNTKEEHPSEFRDISKQFNHILSKEKRMKEGIFFTPKTARNHLFSLLKDINPQIILEPSFGSGEFLLDIRERYPTATVIGVEKNQDLYNSVPPDTNLHNADFLEWNSDIQADLIIGNPPYFVMKKGEMSENALKLQQNCQTGRTNIFILFLYKCLKVHLKAGGILAFIIPTSIYNCSYYQLMRDYISANTTILHLETLNDVGFYETGQETTLIILKKDQSGENKEYIFLKQNVYISPFWRELALLSANTTTIAELGLAVKTGSVVWNQVKDKLTDDKVNSMLLIYSSNIVNGELVLDNLKNNKENTKKQYIINTNKPTLQSPVILVERGYGNSYSFNYTYLGDFDGEFYAENYVNVIYAKSSESTANLQLVANSFNDERMRDFMRYFIGNGTISATDIQTIIPIYN